MKLVKALFLFMAVGGIGFTAAPTPSYAQGVFNSAVSNPFVFCSLPKPCKRCQPYRRIYQQICPAGQPSADAKKQYQDAIATNHALAATAITPEQFKSQLTPAIQSAYQDVIHSSEVGQYIDWLAKQPVPEGVVIPKRNGGVIGVDRRFSGNDRGFSGNNRGFSGNTRGNTMADYWAAQGITDPASNPQIRETATNVIQQTNEKIVASISTGTIPQNPKPWY